MLKKMPASYEFLKKHKLLTKKTNLKQTNLQYILQYCFCKKCVIFDLQTILNFEQKSSIFRFAKMYQ